MTEALDDKCKSCKAYRNVVVFDLCTRDESRYTVAGKDDFHTVGHMRLYQCGKDARLWRPF